MSWRRKQFEALPRQDKPSHRVFCIDCGRPKLLFKGAKNALAFIKFNGETIALESGFKPIRAYECVCCCGWHVTSHGKREGVRSRAERLLNISAEEMKQKYVYYQPSCR